MQKAKRVIVLTIMCIFLSVCVLAEETIFSQGSYSFSSDRDGSSIEEAVIIKYTGDYPESIGQEYIYLAKYLGSEGKDWRLKQQQLIEKDNKFYDVLTVEISSTGEIKRFYFDITEPFGELQKQFSPPPEQKVN